MHNALGNRGVENGHNFGKESFRFVEVVGVDSVVDFLDGVFDDRHLNSVLSVLLLVYEYAFFRGFNVRHCYVLLGFSFLKLNSLIILA